MVVMEHHPDTASKSSKMSTKLIKLIGSATLNRSIFIFFKLIFIDDGQNMVQNLELWVIFSFLCLERSVSYIMYHDFGIK